MDFQTILRKDQQLCRYSLLEEELVRNCPCGDTADDMICIPVNGVQAFWEQMSLSAHLEVFRHLVASLNEEQARFSFILKGDESGVHFYYGCRADHAEALRSTLRGMLFGADIGENISQSVLIPGKRGWYGGAMVGQPGEIDTAENQAKGFKLPVDVLCGSMLGSEFVVAVQAERILPRFTMQMRALVQAEDQTISPLLERNIVESKSRQENRVVEDYSRHLQMAAADLEAGIRESCWSTSVFYAAGRATDCERIEAVLKSAWMGKRESVYQPLHCLPMCGSDCVENRVGVTECIGKACLPCVKMRDAYENVLAGVNGRAFNAYQLRTVLTGEQLSRLCQLPRHEYPGYYVDAFVEFDTARRAPARADDLIAFGEVVRPGRVSPGNGLKNPYTIETDDLTRHLLVVGITGGGKTNTTKSILTTLWHEKKRPFLVIESAKREYHTLMNLTRETDDGREERLFPEINLFTMGDENPGTGLPYRLNPFEVMKGASIQTHIDYLLCTFKAAFELYPPMPYVLETMVYEVYSDLGWDVTTNQNRYGYTVWPTLTDLYNKIDEVTDRLGYYEEVKNNVKAALRARINSLRIGGKGAMLDVPVSIPLQTLLNRPTVLELEDLGDDDSKAFVIGILMVQLYEYRKICPPNRKLQHLLVIEEAHRLLKKVSSSGEGDQSRAKSVEFFCNMLSEIRSYGQGIMICDQVPTRLADDALKNTNCKIVHRTVMQEDREAIGRAMHMSEEQVDYLSSLLRGRAAVFSEGDHRPKLVLFPYMEEKGGYTRGEILNKCRALLQNTYADAYRSTPRHCRACRLCSRQECLLKLFEEKNMLKKSAVANVWREFFLTVGTLDGKNLKNLVDQVDRHCRTALDAEGKLCLAGMLLDRAELQESEKNRALGEYYAYVFQKKTFNQ